VGTVLFVNYPYPKLSEDVALPQNVTIGPECSQPFHTTSLFNISAMSYGAISRPAVRALSNGARMANCWYNTGEGGLTPYHLEGNSDLVFQIGTAKYGVRNAVGSLDDQRLREVAAHEQVRMFELKLSQGAKPGKGGILPGGKVTPEVAAIRGISVGKDSISPNRHPEINNEHDLLDMLDRIRQVAGKPAGIKFVLGDPNWLDVLFNAINRRGALSAPDFITLDSADGGTGAAPMSLIDYMGMPIQESLPELVDRLHTHGLQERIKVVASGKLVTPGQVAWAMCMGADFVTSARGFMFALGCIQAMQCNKNTCPTGITTHNPRLQKGLNPMDKAQRVANYVNNIVKEVGTIAHSCGVSEPRQLNRKHARVVTDEGYSVSLADYSGPSRLH
jgi:glutamate synthase domain-containing protein 2